MKPYSPEDAAKVAPLDEQDARGFARSQGGGGVSDEFCERCRPFVAAREAQAAAKAETEAEAWRIRAEHSDKGFALAQRLWQEAKAERDVLTERLAQRSEALDRVVAEVERLRATVARVEALAARLAQIHNRLHGDVEINGHAHLTGERDLIRRVHDDLRAALEGDR